jgi:hypothetical protein
VDRARSFGPAKVMVIEQILDRQIIEAQGYLDCQNMLDGLRKRNCGRLEDTCQELITARSRHLHDLETHDGRNRQRVQTPRHLTPAASTRNRVNAVTFQDTILDVTSATPPTWLATRKPHLAERNRCCPRRQHQRLEVPVEIYQSDLAG